MLSHQELVNHVLAYLYLIKQKNTENLSRSYSLRGIILHLNQKATSEDLKEVSRYLEAKNYINADYIIGDIFVSLTYRGVLYVEELTHTGVLEKIEKLIQTSKEEELYKEEIKQIREPIYALLKIIKASVLKHFGKTSINTQELSKDLEIMKLELEKRNPDKDILGIKISHLESQFVGEKESYLRELKYMLNLV